MATNFVGPGDVLEVFTAGALSSDDGYMLNDLFGVALHDAGAGETVSLAVTGRWTLPKEAPLVINQGDRLFWEPGNSRVDKTATGQRCIGIAAKGAASADTTVEVLLRGSTPTGT